MTELVKELACASPWSYDHAKAVVDACAKRGMDVDETRRFCSMILRSGLPAIYWLNTLDTV
jgi:hypothetical protein